MFKQSHLCVCHRAGPFVLLRQEEANGHEEFVHTAAKLFVILAPCGECKQPPRLDNVFKDVLCCLQK